MMRISATVIAPALAFAVLTLAPGTTSPGFAPGQWEHHTNLVSASVPGVPQWLIKLVAGHSIRRNCPSAEEAQYHPERLLQGDDNATCKLRKLSMLDGKLEFDTFCTNKRFPDGLLVSSRGTYTSTSYAISTTSTGTKDGKPVRILTTGSGKRIAGTCEKP
ncbi:DUF3617 domain-containing protein [Novosphingobium sp. 9]|uniref:DUF3617 domain-containing protein n=1 Tax=Novosphingobium sp. 9 TaxID=2025349 RepID=UPI0021B67159|nr:DUF3617 domain-containing protein [Novosphingobium sp. 9]